jgi:squalene synthase HpnC
MEKAGRENFTVASFLLPTRDRRHLLAVYGFARLVDDAGDEAAGDREALLDELEADLGRAYDGRPSHPLMRQLAPTVRERALPREPFLRLIEANRQDQRVARYETFDDLVRYCHLSANPVGELVLRVFGAATPERIAASDAVCTGLQLAEHWQDVGEDYARGRIYVPLEDLRRFGVEEEDLGGDRATPAFRELMAFEVERAWGLLDRGVPLVASLRGRQRLAVAGYVGGGRAALDAVERSGFEVLAEPPRATRRARVAAVARVMREAR